jgi:hypothetical protein
MLKLMKNKNDERHISQKPIVYVEERKAGMGYAERIGRKGRTPNADAPEN